MALVISPDCRTPPSAITGILCFSAALAQFDDRGDLRDADAGDDSGRTDRAGPDADLHGVCPCGDQVLRSLGGRNITRNHVDIIFGFDFLDRLNDVLRMAVGGIDHDNIDIRPISASMRS